MAMSHLDFAAAGSALEPEPDRERLSAAVSDALAVTMRLPARSRGSGMSSRCRGVSLLCYPA